MDFNRPAEAPSLSPDAIEFVRFCYRRRRVGWPELYDEMCAVAGRGLYRGWRFAELAEHGIGFSLHETLELARIANQVALEEGDRRGRVPGRTVGSSAAGVAPTELEAAAAGAHVSAESAPIIDVRIVAPADRLDDAPDAAARLHDRPAPVAPARPAESISRSVPELIPVMAIHAASPS
jgi:hypothetical protein